MKLYDENRYEEVHVAGDAPLSKRVQQQGRDGSLVTTQLVDTPRVKILYRDMILEGEVYQEPGGIMVNILCPKCRHSLRINSKNKEIDWEPRTGRISIEKSKCPWEIDTNLAVGVLTHTNLCNWTFAIDNNVARDV